VKKEKKTGKEGTRKKFGGQGPSCPLDPSVARKEERK
jgi:hypothetical protein